MKYRVEEAIIIETKESEPHFKVETVVPERLDKRPSRMKTTTLFEDLFDMFFDSFDIFGLLDEEDLKPEPKRVVKNEPEPAIIVETHERIVQEQYYFIYEIIE